jgi:Ca2+-dependent lipid-binding protein
VRVVLTPLISRIPIIGGLQVYFTKEPRIRFDLNKITQILDLPVIHTKIHNTVMKIVNSKFLYPNAYSINLTQGINMSRLTVFRTEGVLRVHVVEGKNLVNKDFIGKSDPYVVMSVASIRVETPVVQNSLNPKWDFWTEFEIDCNSELKVEVFDKDEGSKDDFLGCTKLDIAEVVRTGQVDKLMHLQDVKQGMIHIRLWWLSLSSDYTDLEAAINDTKMLSPHIHTALLMIYLESSLNLPMHHKTEPTPYVKLEIENKTKKTDPEQQTCQPLWDKGFTFMIRDPKRAVLNITVVDNDSERNIGELSFQIDSLSNEPNIELKRHTFFFNKPYSDASICCTMKLRLFKNEKSSDEENDVESTPKTRVLEKQKSTASTKSKISRTSVSSGSVATDWENESWYFSNQDSSQYDITAILGKIKLSLFYSEQRQKLIVYIYEVQIENSSSTHDPYVKLYLQTNIHPDHKKKTKAIKNTNNPVYNKEIDYLISTQDLNFTCLVVVVESDRGFFDVRKKFLGHTIISLKNCAELNEPIISWFDLIQKNQKYVHHLIK